MVDGGIEFQLQKDLGLIPGDIIPSCHLFSSCTTIITIFHHPSPDPHAPVLLLICSKSTMNCLLLENMFRGGPKWQDAQRRNKRVLEWTLFNGNNSNNLFFRWHSSLFLYLSLLFVFNFILHMFRSFNFNEERTRKYGFQLGIWTQSQVMRSAMDNINFQQRANCCKRGLSADEEEGMKSEQGPLQIASGRNSSYSK